MGELCSFFIVFELHSNQSLFVPGGAAGGTCAHPPGEVCDGEGSPPLSKWVSRGFVTCGKGGLLVSFVLALVFVKAY